MLYLKQLISEYIWVYFKRHTQIQGLQTRLWYHTLSICGVQLNYCTLDFWPFLFKHSLHMDQPSLISSASVKEHLLFDMFNKL